MPNWTEHDLHIVGKKADIDRFLKTGFNGDELQFRRLCPLGRDEPEETYFRDSGLVNLHFRTRTQALFAMVTAWDYEPEFYKRLPRHWPTLDFASAVTRCTSMCSLGESADVDDATVHSQGRTDDALRIEPDVFAEADRLRDVLWRRARGSRESFGLRVSVRLPGARR